MTSGALRRGLDALYDGAAWLAAFFMIGLLAMVLLSIAGRQFHFHLPGTDSYAGYMMAAAGFLALAHTFKRNEHVRVIRRHAEGLLEVLTSLCVVLRDVSLVIPACEQTL